MAETFAVWIWNFFIYLRVVQGNNMITTYNFFLPPFWCNFTTDWNLIARGIRTILCLVLGVPYFPCCILKKPYSAEKVHTPSPCINVQSAEIGFIQSFSSPLSIYSHTQPSQNAIEMQTKQLQLLTPYAFLFFSFLFLRVNLHRYW